MKVELIGNDRIYKTILPDSKWGTYYICDDDGNKIISIQGNGEEWYIHNNAKFNILPIDLVGEWEKINNTNSRGKILDKKIILRNYEYNYVIARNKKVLILYCSPIIEEYKCLQINDLNEILIGNEITNHIIYRNQLLKKVETRIFINAGVLFIETYGDDSHVYVNNKKVKKEKKFVFNGDIISILGLRIIVIGKKIWINNPNKKVLYKKSKFQEYEADMYINKFQEIEEESEEIEFDLEETNYFSRAPRIMNMIQEETVKIDPPPQVDKKNGMPFYMVMGSSLMMGLISIISIIQAMDGLHSGTATIKDTVFSMSMSVAMLLGMILIPVLDYRYEKKEKKEYEKTRQKRYREYIDSKEKDIMKIMQKQRSSLFKNYISTEECIEIINENNSRLWERKAEDEDFLNIRLGIGNIPLKIDIQYPEEQFTMEDDDLLDKVKTLGEKSKILKSVPVTISLMEKNIVALVIKNNKRLVEKFIQSMVIQLVTFHSYDELKICFLLQNNQSNLEYMSMLPHLWDNGKKFRFFAENYKEIQEIAKYLESEFNYRISRLSNDSEKHIMPYYIIITDDYRKIANIECIEKILKNKVNIGFSIFCISDNFNDLPDECQTFITVEGRKGKVFDGKMSSSTQIDFQFDDTNTIFFENISNKLANIPVKVKLSKQLSLPSSYTFLEMYNAGKIESLNILTRWKNNDSCKSLSAPIGIDSSGELISLDIHEKADGPHGLIAGSTGSGKSEFIITYILSLAINYSPKDVNFVLIDYKGGGLAGAFKKNDVVLPHLVGTITNIDTLGLNRSLASIQSELKKRQILFNEAREKTDEGTIDIYKYQKLYHEGKINKPIAHLLIICDEFAELKQQQEDFMDELISVARIGRSLGVHLILATQKPSGIVNDQIRSNSKFGICLKVQDKEDSMDVIKRPEAANLQKAGQFYIQVGNNEYFALGQSAWSGAPYYPSEEIKKKEDTSIGFISNTGAFIKKIDNEIKNNNKEGEQLTNIVKYLYKVAKEQDITVQNLWIDDIPDTIYLNDIKEKYKISKKSNQIDIVIGEFDDPSNQRQGPVKYNLLKSGNFMIYGNATSGKETLLSTLVYDLISNYTSEEVNIYILDFGTESLKIFKKSPQVGDIVFINEEEKINRFFLMIRKIISERIKILSDFGGDYNLYLQKSGNSMPLNIIILNGYEVFSENYEDKYEDEFLSISRDGNKCGIIFIVTASNPEDIRYRLSQNFKQKIVLQLNNEEDYYTVIDGIGKRKPANKFGRGLIKIDDIYDFQVAKICSEENWNENINSKISILKNMRQVKNIPTIPEYIRVQDFVEYIQGINAVPIGIETNNLEVYKYNFIKNIINIITAKNIEFITNFILALIEEVKKIDNINMTIIDNKNIIKNIKTNNISVYQNFILSVKNQIKSEVRNIGIIIGVDNFFSMLEENDINFEENLKLIEENTNTNLIFVDSANKMKELEYEDWYKKYVSGEDGIWIGNGVDEQYLINISDRKDINNNCGKSMAHVIKDGSVTQIKLLGAKD